ncbi:MAG: hypothetical protein NZ455_07710 [Bacteroidia bacterium]|nr:hypothetical protein [Bacteroidia bacterium]MDW8346684.1 hypothetical protein [Bacteroidia bacterium]
MKAILAFVSFFISLFTFCQIDYNVEILEIANQYPDGGGYQWSGTGCPENIFHKNQLIISKSATNTTYCCGFTFAVVMKLFQKHNLIEEKTVPEIKKFQQEWYAATPQSAEKQAVTALTHIGLGKEVRFQEAKAGDFVQFWRGKTGHSAIFKSWIINSNGDTIGIHYRSTQKSTNGIADNKEYFEGIEVEGRKGEIIRKRTYFARVTK